MKLSASIITHLLKRKIATAVLLSASLAAFAALGDGGRKQNAKNTSFPSASLSSKTFSLRSGYNYKSNKILDVPAAPKQFIMLNTVATFEKGNATYVLPLKKKVFLNNKITFRLQ